MPALALLLLGTTPAVAATITRGPYLQLLTTESVTIVWNTDVTATCGLAVRTLGGGTTTILGATGPVCAIPVPGLAVGTRYGYTPLADGVSLAPEWIFRTDDPSAAFSFHVIGDHGCACSNQYTLRDRMLATPADFILSVGDMVYENGAAYDFDPKFFAPYRDLIRRLVFWPTLGNHDVQVAGGAGQPWRDAFYTPANNAAANENYYSFDVGNAHIAVLDSNVGTSPSSAQYAFLNQDLAASTATWKFVAFHHTIYSSSAHGSATSHRTNLRPLFDQHHVDVVFMGHDHDFERTHSLLADQIVPAGQGTVYITTGGGGRELYPAGQSSFTAYAESAFHFVRVAVDGGGLLLNMIRADGTIGDTLTIVKGTAPVAVCGDDLVNQPTEECDGADHPACRGACRADCTCEPSCGDEVVDAATEDCDGASSPACPGFCLTSCRCGDPAQFITLDPVADTYVESGAQATWDHGLAGLLKIDESPIDVAYLRFDLSGMTVPVNRATLTLFCSNASDDGGTVYLVGDSSWIEGNQSGANSTSVNGPGLKWPDVDSNGDGTINALDSSPYRPVLTLPLAGFEVVAAGRAYTVDVTPAFQNTAELVSLSLTSGSSDGVAYVSREGTTASQRPVLRLELASIPAPTMTPLVTPTASPIRTATPLHTATVTRTPTPTVTRTPTPIRSPTPTVISTSTIGGTPTPALVLTAVADTYIEAGTQATWDHGLSAVLEVDTSPLDIAYLKFDLAAVQGSIVSAQLTLFCTNESPDGGTIYRVASSSWIEGNQPGTSAGSSAGPGLKWVEVDTNNDAKVDALDSSPYVPAFASPIVACGPVVAGQPVTVNVTSAFQGGAGLVTLAIRSASTNGATYSSSQNAAASQRPVLRLIVATSSSPTPSQTSTPSARAPTPTPTATSTATALPTATGTASSTSTSTPTATATRTVTATPSVTTTTIATATTSAAPTAATATTTGTPTRTATPTGTISATRTPTATPSPTGPVDLAPLADTYIEAGTERTWDHGISDHLDVDLSPLGLTYLTFDLTGVTGPVTSATLTLWCSNKSNDGGTIHPVADPTWIEGNRTGLDATSANGPGLKWIDVDTNGDGKVDALDTSPYVPATTVVRAIGAVPLNQAVMVDVTAAFQAGPQVYAIAIRSASSDGATYSSREHPTVAQRPRLRLLLGPP